MFVKTIKIKKKKKKKVRLPERPSNYNVEERKKFSVGGKNDEKVCGIYIQTFEFFRSYYHAERAAVD